MFSRPATYPFLFLLVSFVLSAAVFLQGCSTARLQQQLSDAERDIAELQEQRAAASSRGESTADIDLAIAKSTAKAAAISKAIEGADATNDYIKNIISIVFGGLGLGGVGTAFLTKLKSRRLEQVLKATVTNIDKTLKDETGKPRAEAASFFKAQETALQNGERAIIRRFRF